MSMTPGDAQRYAEDLIEVVRKHGGSMGNKSLRAELARILKEKYSFDMSEDDFWQIRNVPIKAGKLVRGKGYGGSVSLPAEEAAGPSATRGRVPLEDQLYDPFIQNYVKGFWVGNSGIRDFVVEKTAYKGKTRGAGKWTCPDVTVIAVKTYTFTPGRSLEVTTFEVKPAGQYDVAGVFEAASHSVYSHNSYLVMHCPQGRPDTVEFGRVETLCKRFGVGLIIFSDVADSEKYTTLLDAERKNPDPSDIDDFIPRVISTENQNQLHQWMK